VRGRCYYGRSNKRSQDEWLHARRRGIRIKENGQKSLEGRRTMRRNEGANSSAHGMGSEEGRESGT
jgi:hypothetical protein